MEARVKALTYGSYIRTDDLLSLQTRLSHAHDELQFIIVHQVFELWFKLLLFELESVREALDQGELRGAVRLLRRVAEICRVMTGGFDVLETMRPWDFLEFRSHLRPASGFQSRQFREVEFLSGLKDPRYLRSFEEEPEDLKVLRRRLEEPSVWDAFVGLLHRRGLAASSEAELLHALIHIHREPALRDLDELCEALLGYDEAFSLWRHRHVLMVERMIGARPGTGQEDVQRTVGSSEGNYFTGVDYLRATLSKRFFPLLWEARTFVEREA
ncbi:MAG: tryptophan 2,3-dioxygenase family protein [Armatimonadota bacterium]|nr:tryptophan 2,3-dioxygenase family protein [Armatimonadota bacterium]MDR7440138.1 tryptophan 2,3-dioxygenase family protein [Armatimonadota bacterium]MDR7562932.1 tryptophan 2,3-dioxygenase family protein [Armatimonadota bacterium]MDR7567999.1 tryptophan 2,3-dioxygenase family protein [Armatimonadota bacterium]MDR7601430.1 tryptophan 2,3-dioxygenase family protein [Armatimonadota bacterium]